MQKRSYGPHLIIDAYGAPRERLSDMSLLYRFLERLPALIGMRRVGIPQILEVEEEGIAGLSGFVFIMESHIAIHTYAERGFLSADIYSCREFDVTLALGEMQETFGYLRYESTVLERGKNFYDEEAGESAS